MRTGAEWNVWWSPNLSVQTPRRVRTGCDSCKKSRVKCDEVKPTCNRCARRGDSCHYGSKTWTFEQSHHGQKNMEVSRGPFPIQVVTKKPMSREFFFQYLVPANSPYHSIECWNPMFVSRLQSEPAIAHLLTALSIVHRAYWIGGDDPAADLSGAYFSSINAAIRHLTNPKSPSPLLLRGCKDSKTLPLTTAQATLVETHFLATLLLAFCESTRSSTPEAIWPHIRSLVTLYQIRQQHTTSSPSTSAARATLDHAARLLAVSAGMTISSLSRPSTATSTPRTVSSVTPNLLPQIGCSFRTLAEAARTLENILLFWFLPLLRRPAPWITPLPPARALSLLQQWRVVFALQDVRSTLVSVEARRMGLQLGMHARAAGVAARCVAGGGRRGMWKGAVQGFEGVVGALEEVTAGYRGDGDPFALSVGLYRGLGLIPAAVFVVGYCTDEGLRGRALGVLRMLGGRWVEGKWNAGVAARVCEVVMEVERDVLAFRDGTGEEEEDMVWPVVRAESIECSLSSAVGSSATPTGEDETTAAKVVIMRVRCAVTAPTFSQETAQLDQVVREVLLDRADDRPQQSLGPCVQSWGYLHNDLYPTPYMQSEAFASEFMERYIS
ncbi:hypothetical protein FH972_024642 [Carpinus fangiana]|uniref:Zn(2)-C6 fungal-type domain-containing protein n=1 Tax=Carpinus fangiana TaxID=176857 RepID=A0A5N6KYK0_9ROSI|nr:hypothetical protein FH972_024642 [Carpinus fangiana]